MARTHAAECTRPTTVEGADVLCGGSALGVATLLYAASAAVALGVSLGGPAVSRTAALAVLGTVGGGVALLCALFIAMLMSGAVLGAPVHSAERWRATYVARTLGAGAHVFVVFVGTTGVLSLAVVLYAALVPRHVGDRYARAALAAYACQAVLVCITVVYRIIRRQHGAPE